MSALLTSIKTITVIAIVALLSSNSSYFFSYFDTTHDVELMLIFFEISLLGLLSFLVYYLAHKTIVPSFVLALFFGMAAKPLLSPIVNNNTILSVLVTLGATLILFGGGLEITFSSFKKLLYKITSISVIGFLVTSFLCSGVMLLLSHLLNVGITPQISLLLGVIVASTDPAAIIPALTLLRFKNKDIKDIIISESAITDALGAVLTIVILGQLLDAHATLPSGIFQAYAFIFTDGHTWALLSKEVGIGILLGIGGYGLLELLKHLKVKSNQETGVDANYFIGVPIVIFAIAILLGGNGFVAAFISGLLIMVTEHLHDTEHYFNQTIDGFLKPTIFLLLGALVDTSTLITYAPIGIMLSLCFILIVRPLAVWISLSPFLWTKKPMKARELWFISFIRETGAIPAVLLVTVNTLELPQSDALLAVGMWIILITLIVQPPLIPYVAKYLGVAEAMDDDHELALQSNGEPLVVLCTRGNSYAKRLPAVASWASEHSIRHVALLSCLERNYTEEAAQELENNAHRIFADVNTQLHLNHKRGLKFTVITRQGFLHDNLDQLIAEEGSVSVIFVGRKMLDYKISDIKNAQVPFFFID